MFIRVTNNEEVGCHINTSHIIKIICTLAKVTIQMTDDYQIDITPNEFLNNVYPHIYSK